MKRKNMMKKFLAFACCVAPFSAVAADPIIINPGKNFSYVDDGFSVLSGSYAVVQSGIGFALGDDGMSIGSLYVGQNSSAPGTPNGEVFVEVNENVDNNYTIRSDGNISITNLLEVVSGHSLGIGPKTQTGGNLINTVSLGSVEAAGALSMEGIDALTTNTVTSGDVLNITANTMTTTGNINSNAGKTILDVANTLTVTGNFINNGNAGANETTVQINAGNLSVGSFQNNAGAAVIVSDGAITSAGNFENVGTSLTVMGATSGVAPSMLVNGTMRNDADSTMTLNLSSLEITGGTGINASFVNKGNLGIVVSGVTNLANGFDLSGMQSNNTFSLHTGKLVLGGGADGLSQIFENNTLESFELIVDDLEGGSVVANNITNGQGNSAANMNITVGGDITAETIQNYGTNLTVATLEDSGGDITLSATGSSIYGKEGSVTNIIADGTLSAAGAVSNNGTMTLNGNEIELTSVSNNGGNLTIQAQTDPTGSIYLSGGTSNLAGTTEISARQIKIDGVVSTSGGTTTINGSDANNGASVYVGGIKALGGVTNLDALIHSAQVGGDVLVSGGTFNIGSNLHTLDINGGTQISGNLTFSGTDASGAGDVNVANGGVNRFVLTSTGQISIGKDVIAEEDDIARTGSLVADVIEVGGDVSVANKGNIAFGDASSTTLSIAGDVTANNGGTLEIYSGATTLKSLSGNGKFIMHGDSVTAQTGAIDVSNGIWYDGTTNPASGMVISDTDEFTLQTIASGQDVDVANGMSVASGTLNILSAHDVNVSGNVAVSDELNVTAANVAEFTGGSITVSDGGAVSVNGASVATGAINVGENSSVELVGTANTNSVTTSGLVASAGTLDIMGKQIQMSALQTTGGVSTVGGATTTSLQVGTVDVSNGTAILQGTTINSTSMALSGGTTRLSGGTIAATGDIVVSGGNLNQGGTTGRLILTNSGTLSASNLTVSGGMLDVDGGEVTYNIANNATFANGIDVSAGSAIVNAKAVSVGGAVNNAAGLTLNTTNNLSLGAIQNTGNLVLKTTGSGSTVSAASLTNNSGTAKITSNALTLSGPLTAGGILYQNYSGSLSSGDVNITSANHTLTTSNLIVNGINQATNASVMTIKSSDVDVSGNIVAKDLRIQANPTTDWLDVNVTGNVSGGTKFVGLEHMYIGGNYTFDDGSMIHAVILPTPGVTINSTTYNYWSTVSLADDNTLGKITNATDGTAAPLISVHGQFINNVTDTGSELSDAALVSPQVGIDIFDMVDSGTAIWLLHSDSSEGLAELSDKIRNLNVNFCNASGTRCFKYFNNDIAENADANQTKTNLPAYLTVRDIDEDGVTDSIYIVFDSRFGGPVEVFKIQPIVDRVDDHTDGEHDAAGALDDMIAGGLQDAEFYNHTPIEAIPVAFEGTNLETLANELYNRMEQYVLNRDGTPLARISRLVQPREIEQIAGSVIMNEHITFRDFEDHMFDEFIWNRHRSLEKVWVDADYGLFYQNTSDGKRANGDRFSITGGYDWQHTPTLILGLTGHVSHMSADDTDAVDLSYRPGERVDGNVSFDVADTNIGIGAYLVKILGTKSRVYGNAFLDLHLLDVSRDQNFVSHIDGSGSAFSIISEWGYLHDWLNQYIVGDLYARVGYNFGFSVKEKAAGDEYMHLESDGYMILTPGYSLIAQKRFYPSSWFQIRPYLSAGVEYDVLGAPDYASFKFRPAKSYTKYDIEINPLWANIGGGVELLSSSGFQVGLDYRYQYNTDIQLHKVRLSGSYRF